MSRIRVRIVRSYAATWTVAPQCELAGSGASRYFLTETDDALSHLCDVEGLINVDGDVLWLCGSLGTTSTEVETVEVRTGDFLVLTPHNT